MGPSWAASVPFAASLQLLGPAPPQVCCRGGLVVPHLIARCPARHITNLSLYTVVYSCTTVIYTGERALSRGRVVGWSVFIGPLLNEGRSGICSFSGNSGSLDSVLHTDVYNYGEQGKLSITLLSQESG